MAGGRQKGCVCAGGGGWWGAGMRPGGRSAAGGLRQSRNDPEFRALRGDGSTAAEVEAVACSMGLSLLDARTGRRLDKDALLERVLATHRGFGVDDWRRVVPHGSSGHASREAEHALDTVSKFSAGLTPQSAQWSVALVLSALAVDTSLGRSVAGATVVIRAVLAVGVLSLSAWFYRWYRLRAYLASLSPGERSLLGLTADGEAVRVAGQAPKAEVALASPTAAAGSPYTLRGLLRKAEAKQNISAAPARPSLGTPSAAAPGALARNTSEIGRLHRQNTIISRGAPIASPTGAFAGPVTPSLASPGDQWTAIAQQAWGASPGSLAHQPTPSTVGGWGSPHAQQVHTQHGQQAEQAFPHQAAHAPYRTWVHGRSALDPSGGWGQPHMDFSMDLMGTGSPSWGGTSLGQERQGMPSQIQPHFPTTQLGAPSGLTPQESTPVQMQWYPGTWAPAPQTGLSPQQLAWGAATYGPAWAASAAAAVPGSFGTSPLSLATSPAHAGSPTLSPYAGSPYLIGGVTTLTPAQAHSAQEKYDWELAERQLEMLGIEAATMNSWVDEMRAWMAAHVRRTLHRVTQAEERIKEIATRFHAKAQEVASAPPQPAHTTWGQVPQNTAGLSPQVEGARQYIAGIAQLPLPDLRATLCEFMRLERESSPGGVGRDLQTGGGSGGPGQNNSVVGNPAVQHGIAALIFHLKNVRDPLTREAGEAFADEAAVERLLSGDAVDWLLQADRHALKASGYIRARLTDWASGDYLRGYSWKGGRRGWNPSLPTDGNLVAYLFAAFLQEKFEVAGWTGKSSFSSKHLLTPQGQARGDSPQEAGNLVLQQVRMGDNRGYHFRVLLPRMWGDHWECPLGSDNPLHAITLFLYGIMHHCHGRLGPVDLTSIFNASVVQSHRRIQGSASRESQSGARGGQGERVISSNIRQRVSPLSRGAEPSQREELNVSSAAGKKVEQAAADATTTPSPRVSAQEGPKTSSLSRFAPPPAPAAPAPSWGSLGSLETPPSITADSAAAAQPSSSSAHRPSTPPAHGVSAPTTSTAPSFGFGQPTASTAAPPAVGTPTPPASAAPSVSGFVQPLTAALTPTFGVPTPTSSVGLSFGGFGQPASSSTVQSFGAPTPAASAGLPTGGFGKPVAAASSLAFGAPAPIASAAPSFSGSTT